MTNAPLRHHAIVEHVGTVPAGSAGTTITSGSADTKGAYGVIIDPIPESYESFLLTIGNRVNNSMNLIDIAIGADGVEEIIVDNLYQGSLRRTNPWMTTMLPLRLPAGERLVARHQTDGASDPLDIGIHGMRPGSADAPAGFAAMVAEGEIDSSNTKGTEVDPGAVNDTKGAWAELTASSAQDYAGLYVALGVNNNATTTALNHRVDVGIGGEGVEDVIIPDLFALMLADETIQPWICGPFMIDVPAGSRLSVRAQCNDTTDATDRKIDAVLYGLVA